MATTNPNPTVIGTFISNPNNESPATLQRKLIPLIFTVPDNIVTTAPVESNVTVRVDSIDTATTTRGDTTTTDYLVTVKITQTLSYCTRNLIGYRECTRTRTIYDVIIMPESSGASSPSITATYDYDVFVKYNNYIAPNIAKTRTQAIVVSVANSATTPSLSN